MARQDIATRQSGYESTTNRLVTNDQLAIYGFAIIGKTLALTLNRRDSLGSVPIDA